MNDIAVFRDQIFKKHVNTDGHPESPSRLDAIDEMIAGYRHKERIVDMAVREATREELGRVHSKRHITRIAESANADHTDFDYETAGNRYSYEAAAKAAGAAIGAVDAVVAEPTRPAYALTRPPGHHAERSTPMGFCLFNNVAVACEHALLSHGIARVAVFDWDVHHGNGTMHSFYDRNDVLYCSAHQYPHYPGTGTIAETGNAGGKGYTINVPLPPGSGDAEYRYVLEHVLVPVLDQYKPDLIVISAGFDAHERDPLSATYLTSDMYGDMTFILREVAREVCDGRFVLVLEGGYDLRALAESNERVFDTLCGDWTPPGTGREQADPHVTNLVAKLKERLDDTWAW